MEKIIKLTIHSWSRSGDQGEARLEINNQIVHINGDADAVAKLVSLAKANTTEETHV